MPKKMSHDELVGRLCAATTRPIPDHVQARHLAAIHATATWADGATDATTGGPAPASRWRRPLAALVTAATVLAPTGVAVASQHAQPGDTLYEVKRVTERFASLVVDDLPARRRIAELRHLIAIGAGDEAIEEAIERALAATAGLPPDHPLLADLAVLLAQLRPAPTPPGDTDQPAATSTDDDPEPVATERAERQDLSTVDEPERPGPAEDDDTDDVPASDDDDTDDTDDTEQPQPDAPALDVDDDDTDDIDDDPTSDDDDTDDA